MDFNSNLDGALQFVKSLDNGSLLLVAGLVVEAGLRLAKTDKPKSLLYTAASCLSKVGALLTAVGAMLDKVLQRTSDKQE